MSQPIKFTEDELKKITELRDGSQAKILEFGQLEIDKILTNQRLAQLDAVEERLKNEYAELQKNEQALVNELKDKYGVGTVDVESGEFIPAK